MNAMITNKLPVTVINVMKDTKQMRVIVAIFDKLSSCEYVELENIDKVTFEDVKL